MNFADENWRYYEGLNTFDFWTGPKPEINHPKYQTVMTRLKKAFHQYNIVRKITNHYINALVGKPFHWYLKNENGETDTENEAEKYLQMWWDYNKQVSISQRLGKGKPFAEAVCQMLVRDNRGSINTSTTGNITQDINGGIGTGYLRLYSPKRYANLQPWKKIILHCPSPGSVLVERDPDGILYRATYSYDKGRETYTLLDNGLTQIVDEQGTREIDLHGRLPVFELSGDCIVTQDIKDAQNAINKSLTLKGENLNFAGFLERVILNGQMPGKWVNDPAAPGGERFVSDAAGMQGGAGKAMYVQGIPIGDRRNPSGYTDPSVMYRDPVDVENFLKDFELNLKCAYLAADLGHLLSAGDGSLSAVSRRTLKEDFVTGLGQYAENIQAVISNIFDTVLLLLSYDLQRPDFTQYSTAVELKLNLGTPLPEERDQNRQDYQAGLLSWTTAVMGTGEVSDPDAEWALKLREREEMRNLDAKEKSFVEDFSDGGDA